MMLEEGEDITDMRDWANPDEDGSRRRRRRRRRWILTSSMIAVALIIAVAIRTSRNKPKYEHVAPDREELFSFLKESMMNVREVVGRPIPTDDLLVVGSYQNKAFNWLADTPDLESIDHTRILQRFALACFYYATYQVKTKHNRDPGTWIDDGLWLSEAHECQWSGVVCSNEWHVLSIRLEHNKLSGRLPFELGLLWEHIKVLELSFNGLTMEGDDWDLFYHLPQLEKLSMSGNYVVSMTGLPSTLTACPKLRKLLLSETMMGGPLQNGVLKNLQKMSESLPFWMTWIDAWPYLYHIPFSILSLSSSRDGVQFLYR